MLFKLRVLVKVLFSQEKKDTRGSAEPLFFINKPIILALS